MKKMMLETGIAIAAFGILAALGPLQLQAQRPPKGPLAPVQYNVNCNAGQTIGEALELGQEVLGHLQINISGVCHEVVQISRSDVTLMGFSSEDGIQAPSSASTEWIVSINGPNMVNLSNLTIKGGGITAFGGASFAARDITIENATDGIGADKGAMGILRHVTIQNMSRFGVNAGSGAHLTLTDESQVHDCAFGVQVSEGGTVRLEASTIENNSQFGVGAGDGGVVSIQNTVIQNNPRFGLYIGSNGTATVANNSVIKSNGGGGSGGQGAHLDAGAVLVLQGATVEGNSGNGIEAQDGSIINLRNGTVQNNNGPGVFLGHSSAVVGNGEIKGNVGWGVQCADSSGWIGASVEIGANGGGATNCE